MPRRSREVSETGYYHVITRGVNKEIVFKDERDYQKYIGFLNQYTQELTVKLVAYCLMNNHVHLLVYDKGGHLSQFMKKIGISYAQYFNKRHERTGHVFQGRFKSCRIEDEGYLITAFKYILLNPEKAGIARAEDYKWSSYHEYYRKDGLTDPAVIRELLGTDIHLRKELDRKESLSDQFLFEYGSSDDRWAAEVIEELLDKKDLQTMRRGERDKYLQDLLEAGLSFRQIERFTGVRRGITQAVSKKKDSSLRKPVK